MTTLHGLHRAARPLWSRLSLSSVRAFGNSTETLEYASSCSFPTSFTEVPLLTVQPHSHDSNVFSFGLPEGRKLDLPVCACLLMRGYDKEGQEAVRPYTPISEGSDGFQLLVKDYPDGVVSRWLHGLSPGDPVSFKHISFNVKKQYPFNSKFVTMLCGGTGITPMYQALQKLVLTPGDSTSIRLLYGSRSVRDILMQDELDLLVEQSHGRLEVVHIIGESPDDTHTAGREGETGWIDHNKVAKYAFPPSEDSTVFVCGLPGLYSALCGPRTEPELAPGSILEALGYTSGMVVKF